ncbi:MAG: TrbC/VirB2 family protein [Acidobacteria bacterium]|nr:TrbC/VirB2 family protein [Acidobacteriota bacterium]
MSFVDGVVRRVADWWSRRGGLAVRVLFVCLLLALAEQGLGAAAADPWSMAASQLCTLFTGVVGRGLAVVAVIAGGLAYAFGEGGSKSAIAGLVFGVGMVLLAPQFLVFFFGGTAITC